MIGASQSKLHTNLLYEKIAVPYVCVYVCVYVAISRPHAHHVLLHVLSFSMHMQKTVRKDHQHSKELTYCIP